MTRQFFYTTQGVYLDLNRLSSARIVKAERGYNVFLRMDEAGKSQDYLAANVSDKNNAAMYLQAVIHMVPDSEIQAYDFGYGVKSFSGTEEAPE